MKIENEEQRQAIGKAAIILSDSIVKTGVPSGHVIFKRDDGSKMMVLIAHDDEADYIADILAQEDDIKISIKKEKE